jgi:CRISPR-associated protein Csd1
LARTHEPPVGSDIPGAKSSAKIVSFNFDSAKSFGKDQSFNSPVSLRTAFQYSTALKWLCRRGSHQKIQIGDATVIFWTERPSEAENLLPWIFEPAKQAEDEVLKVELQTILQRIADGHYPDEFGDPATPFYVLGLSPNVARISVRFWYVSTLGEFIANLHDHFEDLKIVGNTHADLRSSINDLLRETVPLKNGWPDQEKISPHLAGEVTRAVLQGRRYPQSLMQQVLNRVCAEGFVDSDKHKGWRTARHRRAAILKACTNREHRFRNQKENILDAYLNRIHPHPAYQCGRLMAVLAFVQERALNTVNATVVRRFLSAASRAPALYLGRLQVQAEVGHLPKLPGDIPGFLRDEMKQINGELKDALPTRLDQIGQSLFVLGFYQQLAHLEKLVPAYGEENKFHLFRTSQGEWVRSKGEQQLANCLLQLGVKYHYEPRVFLKEGPFRVPDFFIPGAPDCNRTFIEYLGMDTKEYNDRWEQKLAAYKATDITMTRGDNGKLVVIDCRMKPWDDPKMIGELQSILAEVL